jgi:hypothetical protein
MNEAATSFFKELLETGDLPKFLVEQGFATEQPLPHSPRQDVTFDVPLNTKRISPRDLEKAFH